MIRRFPIFLILLLLIMQLSPVNELIAYSDHKNAFNLKVDGDTTTEMTSMTISTAESFDKLSIHLPENSVYHESKTKELNNDHVELHYKKSEHILEVSWQNEESNNVHLVLKNIEHTNNNIILKGYKSDELITEEKHSFTVSEPENNEESDSSANTSTEKQEKNTNSESAQKTNTTSSSEQSTITPFVGNLNVDIDITAQNEEINSGNDAAFLLVFKTTGSMNAYTNAKVVIDLPDTELATFEQDITELKIAGVEPQLNEDNQLVYTFDTLKTGQTYENIIKLKTKNGITPNDTELNINASFEAEEQEKIEDSASVLVTASSAINVSKQFLTLHDEDSKIPLPNKQTVWKIKADMPKTKTGQLYLKEGSEIQIVDELPTGLTYHSMKEGPEPSLEGNLLIWTFDAPTLDEQEELENNLFETELEVILTTGGNTADQELTNEVSVQATFIEDDNRDKSASHTIKVFESIPGTGDIEGTYYVPTHIGPADGKGGLGTNDEKNKNPVVYDDAILAFDHGIAPLPESQHGDFREYKTTYTIDDNLIFKELRTPGGFMYRPGGAWPAGVPLAKDPVFNLEALIDGEHVVLVENADVATVYTRADLGIAADAKVEQIIYNFTYAPSGMLNNGKPKYYFEVKTGYVGEVKNTFNVHGIDARGTSFSKNYHTDGINTIAGPRTAQIAEKPTDQPPIATVGVELIDHIGSFVESGDNRMRVTLKTETSSTIGMTEPLNTVVLLPPGVKVSETPAVDFFDEDGNSLNASSNAAGGSYEILEDNYNGSGRQLVKFNWNDRFLRPGNNVQAEINVSIDEAAANTLTFDVYGFSGDSVLQVPDIDNPGITDTILQTDDEDLNNDGNSEQPRLKSGNEYYMSGQYNIKTEKLVKGELDEQFTYFGKTIPGGSIEYKLTLTNTIGKDISSMTLMDVLPSVDDLGITDNVSRGSKFTPTLEGPIQLPSTWEDKVEIFYSTAFTPKRDDLIKNTVYPDTTTPLSNPDNVDETNWQTASEVSDWSTIHSFKMELKDGVSWINGEDITIQFAMKAPEFNEVEPPLVNKETNPEDRAAWNSFAIATDHGQPVEPLRVGVYMEIDTTVTLLKKGEDGETLEGAVFELQDEDGNTLQKDLTTDSDGKIVVEDLFYGSYQFVETAAPEGYDLDQTPLEFEITGAQEKVEVTFENPLSTGSVELLKVNENGNTLEGAVFELQDEDGNTLRENLTTDSNGKLFVDDLKPGTYQFVEIEAPFGYQLDDTPIEFDIEFNQQETLEIEVENEYTPATFELTKTGEDGNLLAGVEFELQDEDGNTIEENLTTNENGILTIDGLNPGNYQLVETATIDGYDLIDEPIPFEIGLGQDSKTEVTFENPLSTGSVELLKVNENGDTLEGAVFKLQDEDGNTLRENLTTDSDGKLTIEELKPGKYQFVETEAPFGYQLDDTPIEFDIEFNQQETLEIEVENEYTPATFELTKTGEDGNLLAGVEFELQDEDGNTIEENLTTNENGILTIDGLNPGNYQLVETATIDGYDLIDEPIPFEIGLGQDSKTKVTFENPLSTGGVELLKVNENGDTLEGAVFELQDEDGNTLRENLTTDSDGKLIIEELKPGKYQFVETKAPFGYQLNDDNPLEFEIDFNQQEVVEINVINEYITSSVELTKVGENGGVLEGVIFELQDEDGNTIEENLTTNENGILTIDGLNPGNYQLVETATIDGYDLIDEPIPFEISLGQDAKTEVTFENPLSTGSVELLKVNDNGETLEGAVFELQDEDGNTLRENLTTDSDGKLIIEELKPGKYQFVETEAPFGYQLDDTPIEFDIEFNQQETLEIEVENEYTPATFELIKTGEDGNLLAGVEFELQDEDGNTIEENLTTNENGILTIDGLNPGNYQLVETATIDGYDLIDEPIPFEIGLGQNTKTEFTFVNPLSTGSVELLKVNENGDTLENAVFELQDEDGNTLRENLTTDSDGKLFVDDLKPGTYQFVETEAPSSYVLDDSPHKFDIEFDQQNTITVEVENKKQPDVESTLKDDKEKQQGGFLPKTATNIFTIILFGSLLLALGIIAAIYIRKRRQVR